LKSPYPARRPVSNETLRAWPKGLIGEKSFQQVAEEFAEIVIPKVWAREGKKVSRVADRACQFRPKEGRRYPAQLPG